MKTKTIIEKLNAKVVNFCNDTEINSGYCGDFLSFVMGKAPTGCCWFTVMNNINVAGVATLADIGVVVLCEGVSADLRLKERAERENINIIETEYDVFNAVLKVFG